MDYKLVADSSLEFTDELKAFFETASVPLTLTLGDESYTDDESLDVPAFVNAMESYRGAARSSCPSPAAYADAFVSDKPVFAITLSSTISGSYAAAEAGRDLLGEAGRAVMLLDSKSASAGEILVAYKLMELCQSELPHEKILHTIRHFVDGMHTFFALESLDTFIKNGRIPKLVGRAASALGLRPVMCAKNGAISFYTQARGSRQAVEKLAAAVGKNCADTSGRTAVITHCGSEHGAAALKELLEADYGFARIVVQQTAGLSSMYANRGGVLLAF